MTVAVIALVVALFSMPVATAKAGTCATIADGTITDSAGTVLVMGFDEFGYNYQAHLFNGVYDGIDRVWNNVPTLYADYADDLVVMKWSDDWLSNVDCTGDGKLDRGTNGISLGWETNMYKGDYDSTGDGIQDAHYTYFTKIVWVVPEGSLWGHYEIIQEVYNDPVGGLHGLQLKLGSPGFGLNDQWTTPLP